ncbi:hypothetical protein DFH07DRAFT_825253 [Mycena maculata]|uniref:Uncharacterized protein n=1 Tax=Mycena maculata TaxID=230809 RepID=A0AAD7IX73_9AGAR|nr:hypothetical protein DFH07DRAFT_825253 [Mycena maculata]
MTRRRAAYLPFHVTIAARVRIRALLCVDHRQSGVFGEETRRNTVDQGPCSMYVFHLIEIPNPEQRFAASRRFIDERIADCIEVLPRQTPHIFIIFPEVVHKTKCGGTSDTTVRAGSGLERSVGSTRYSKDLTPLYTFCMFGRRDPEPIPHVRNDIRRITLLCGNTRILPSVKSSCGSGNLCRCWSRWLCPSPQVHSSRLRTSSRIPRRLIL